MRVFFLINFMACMLFGAGFPSSYYEIKSVQKQKQEFVNILKPLIIEINNEIKSERKRIKNFLKNKTKEELKELSQAKNISKIPRKIRLIRKKYKFNSFGDTHNILARVNVIPISLALAQGAVESGWGKSRFVRTANNIFGHWTFGKNGIVPKHRTEGKKHKIRIFKTLKDSVRAYALNLNTNRGYREFRAKRVEYISKNMKYTGLIASETMINYSAIKLKYVKLLKSIIKQNGFLKYDDKGLI